MSSTPTRSLVLFAIVHAVLLLPTAAQAETSGALATAVGSFWGQAILLLVLVCLPLVLYVVVSERLAERRTLRDLALLARSSSAFDWLELRHRIAHCFFRVHSAWNQEDMQLAADCMTSWYWQNQQLAHLDRWRRLGLVNRCDVEQLMRIRPLYVSCPDLAADGSGSRLVVSVVATLQDYLAEREGGRVVEGRPGYAAVETVWSFDLEDGRWVVSNIEGDVMSLSYARLINRLPALGAETADPGAHLHQG